MSNSEPVSNPRVVLVLGDGAIRAGFVAGAVGRLVEAIPDLVSRLDIVYGSSASAGNALYLTGFSDEHPGERMWTELLSDPQFIKKGSIRSDGPIYDIEYLVEDIFRKKTPLPEINGGIPTQVGVIFPVLRLGTKQVHYFANKTARSMVDHLKSGSLEVMEGHDIYRLIGAASAAPFVYDRPFIIDDLEMIDAAALAPSVDDIIFSGTDVRYIYIFCRKPPTFGTYIKYLMSTLGFVLFILPFRKIRFPVNNYLQYGIKPFRVRKAFETAFENQERGTAVVIYPECDLGDIDDNSSENLERNYKNGTVAAEKIVERVRSLVGL